MSKIFLNKFTGLLHLLHHHNPITDAPQKQKETLVPEIVQHQVK